MTKPKLSIAEKLFLQELAKKESFSRHELRKVGISGTLLTNLLKYGILVEDQDIFGITRFKVNNDLTDGDT